MKNDIGAGVCAGAGVWANADVDEAITAASATKRRCAFHMMLSPR